MKQPSGGVLTTIAIKEMDEYQKGNLKLKKKTLKIEPTRAYENCRGLGIWKEHAKRERASPFRVD
ncbi:MAG: hypothetical protein ABSG63_06230 [Spirochaetia bacterium]|jgi:hypothetical protein